MRKKTWVPILLVLGIPLAFAFLFEPYWFVWSGRIDPWLYWGTGINLQYFSEFFSDTYYFRRWTVTLPYALMHLLFGEILGLALLASFQLALLGLLMFWLNRSLGHSVPQAASLSIFISANPFIFLAIGEGYITAPSLIFITATLLFLALSAKIPNRNLAKILYAGSGLTFFLVLVSYPALIIVGPFFLFFWLSRLSSKAKVSAFTVSQAVAPALVGFIVGWFSDGIVGQFLTEGGWREFFLFNFTTSVGLASSGEWGIETSTLLTHLLTSPSSVLWLMLVIWGLLYPVRKTGASLSVATKAPNVFLLIGIFSQFFAHFLVSISGGDALINIKIVIFLFFSLLVSGSAILSQHRLFQNRGVGQALLIGLPVTNIAYFFNLDGLENYFFGLLLFLLLGGILIVQIQRLLRSNAERADQTSMLARVSRGGETKTSSSFLGLLSFALASYLVTSAYFPSYGFSHDAQASNPKAYFESVGGEVRALTDSTSGGQRNRYFIWDQREWRGWSPVISSLYGMYSSLSLDPRAEELECDVLVYALSRPRATFLIIGDGQTPDTRPFLESEASRCGLDLELVSEAGPLPYMQQLQIEPFNIGDLK